MSGESLNSIAVLGRDLLLVDVGGGAETHLAATDDEPTARAAMVNGRRDPPGSTLADDGGQEALLARRWAPSTLCGRVWWQMAAGEDHSVPGGHDVAVAPTCRSCLRAVDAWFPTARTPGGVEVLASVVAEAVETFGSVHITGVPAEHVEAVRRAARKHLRERGFRSQTLVVNAVVHVMFDDAYQSIDPVLSQGWINEALERIGTGESIGGNSAVGAHPIDWHTWVADD